MSTRVEARHGPLLWRGTDTTGNEVKRCVAKFLPLRARVGGQHEVQCGRRLLVQRHRDAVGERDAIGGEFTAYGARSGRWSVRRGRRRRCGRARPVRLRVGRGLGAGSRACMNG